jgi:hypothetical protein
LAVKALNLPKATTLIPKKTRREITNLGKARPKRQCNNAEECAINDVRFTPKALILRCDYKLWNTLANMRNTHNRARILRTNFMSRVIHIVENDVVQVVLKHYFELG